MIPSYIAINGVLSKALFTIVLLMCIQQRTDACKSTGTACITSCLDMVDGDYQSCTSCTTYVSCSRGAMTSGRPCPHWVSGHVKHSLKWDDDAKVCSFESKTCFCNDNNTHIVNGGWSPYGQWSACLVSSSGFQFRKRFCNNPTPSKRGKNCVGDDFDLRPCQQ